MNPNPIHLKALDAMREAQAAGENDGQIINAGIQALCATGRTLAQAKVIVAKLYRDHFSVMAPN